MSHSQEYKCRSIGFSVDGRQLRAYRRSVERRASRDEEIMKRRSVTIPKQTLLEKKTAQANLVVSKLSVRSAANRGIAGTSIKPLSPLNEHTEIHVNNTKQTQAGKKLTGSDKRRLQLLQYKEQKLLKQKFEKEAKPVFKVCRVNHGYNPFPLKPTNQSKHEKVDTSVRITRSMAKKEDKPSNAVNFVGSKIPVPFHRNTNKLNDDMKTKVKKKAVVLDKSEAESFAPAGFQFKAPDALYYKSFDIKLTQSNASVLPSTFLPPQTKDSTAKCSKSPLKNDSHLTSSKNNLDIDWEIKSILKNSPNKSFKYNSKLNLQKNENVENCVTPTAQNLSAKKTRFLLPGEEDGISPLVTITRGSSSKRRIKGYVPPQDDDSFTMFTNEEIKSTLVGEKQLSEIKQKSTPEKQDKIIDESLRSSLDNFKGLVRTQRSTFLEKIDDWIKLKSTDTDIPTSVIDDIDCTVGMTNLLMKERFKQFENLIHDCEFQSNEKVTTPEDLQGFWDMVQFQVNDINDRYSNLEKLKENDWHVKSPSPPKKKPVNRKPLPKAKKRKNQSNLRQYIAEARKNKLSSTTPETIKNTDPQSASKELYEETPITQTRRRRSRRLSDVFMDEEKKLANTSTVKTTNKRSPSIGYLLVPTVSLESEISVEKEVQKPRRSVRFLERSIKKENENSSTTSYRTTPYRRNRRKSGSNHSLLSPGIMSDENDFLNDDTFSSPLTTKKLRKPSLLPLGDSTNCLNSENLNDDLISFSPDIKENPKRKTSDKPLRRSTRLHRTTSDNGNSF